ncbi:hypothetical protein JXO52_06915 [bacterium]|nr:hypothetical protein [bacterium]
MKQSIILAAVLLCVSTGSAQEPAAVDSSIIAGVASIESAVDTWDVQAMINARGCFERLLGLGQQEPLVRYYIAYADYRIVTFYFAQEDFEHARRYIDDGIDHLEAALALNDASAEAHILLSSLYGNKIAIKPILGMTLGIKAGTHASRAVSLSPDNPRVAFLSGINAYYTPRMFGGGKEKALQHLHSAVTCFQTYTPESNLEPDWGLADTYVYLGLIHMELHNVTEAETELNNCLALKPQHGWAMELKSQLDEQKDDAQ